MFDHAKRGGSGRGAGRFEAEDVRGAGSYPSIPIPDQVKVAVVTTVAASDARSDRRARRIGTPGLYLFVPARYYRVVRKTLKSRARPKSLGLR